MNEYRRNLDTYNDGLDDDHDPHPDDCQCSSCARYYELVAAFEGDPTLTIEQYEAWEDQQHDNV